MNNKTSEATSRKSLRLWPGVAAVALAWLAKLGIPLVAPDSAAVALLAGVAGGVLVVVWWAFFSRAPHIDRWGAIVLMVVALAVTRLFLHESLATAGMGILFFFHAISVLGLAFVLWAVTCRHLPDAPRRVSMAVAIVLACGFWTLLRTGGVSGAAESDFAWRFTPTPEEELLARADEVPAARPSASEPDPAAPEWPGFRGGGRDGVVAGVRIATDWSASPPVELWRRPVGPGWSSFAARGDLIYTQEQRGDDEIVACYDLPTGAPVWQHRDAARFWESNAGAGPRGTPTLYGGRVYTLGATGIVNVLGALDGSLVWSRDAASDTGAAVPTWGFSGSPLVVDDLVIVAASGSLIAYGLATGEPRWRRPEGAEDPQSYSSPHLLTLDGVAQVVLLNSAGAMSVTPEDGTLLWEHGWKGYPVIQPAATADGDVLISVTSSSGLRRLAASRGADGWGVEERWTSIRLKPYFNDFVVHGGHAFGFDGGILACIDVEDGERLWKGGRYGHGQLVLLGEQDLLLVLSEKGELALVGATPEGFTEWARFPAIAGKTWNHPVLVGDILLARNSQEMAAFRLPLASDI